MVFLYLAFALMPLEQRSPLFSKESMVGESSPSAPATYLLGKFEEIAAQCSGFFVSGICLIVFRTAVSALGKRNDGWGLN
jgi:hypothetical protein